MPTFERARSTIAVLCVAFLTFGGTVWTDERADAALLRERAGLTRGAFVDRHGHPLVWTTRSGARAHSLPGLTPTIGFQDPYGVWYGLERIYGGVLSASAARRDWRTTLLHLLGRSAQGGTVHLTLDRGVQHAADTALGSAKGAVIALEPSTGDVLALVSKPFCSVRTLREVRGYNRCVRNPARPLMDRATDLLVPPGSAFKIATLTAAIDSGRFHLTDIFRGADAFGPNPYFDNVLYPSNVTRTDLTQLTLAQALAFSDNFTFAHLGLTLGSKVFLKYMHRYGLDRTIPFDLPVRVSTVAGGKARLTPGELARSSFGAEDDEVTPLQMAIIVETVANGGVAMAPHLVASLSNASGSTTMTFRDHPMVRVMSKESAAEVVRGMEFVVDKGSGFNAQIKGMRVGGKTGTAASGSSRPHAWFIAFAPARHPVAAVAVLHEFSGEGFEYAAPIARKVLLAALRERGFHVE